MTPTEFVEAFAVPLVKGGAVRLGLPTDQGFYEAIEATPNAQWNVVLRPVLDPLWAKGRERWARMPEIALERELAMCFALCHDLMLGMHSFGAKWATSWYMSRLLKRAWARVDQLGTVDPVELVVRDVVVTRCFSATRHDTSVSFEGPFGIDLGTIKGEGRAPDWVRFPWRSVRGKSTETVEFDGVISRELLDVFHRLSPLTAVRDIGRPARKIGTLEIGLDWLGPLLAHRPLARLVVDGLDTTLGRSALAVSILSHESHRPGVDPAFFDQTGGHPLESIYRLALYLRYRGLDASNAAREVRWSLLIDHLKPWARKFGLDDDPAQGWSDGTDQVAPN